MNVKKIGFFTLAFSPGSASGDNDLNRGYFTIISPSYFHPSPIRVPTTDRTQKSPSILSSPSLPYSLSLPSPLSIFPSLKINHTLSPISPTSQKTTQFQYKSQYQHIKSKASTSQNIPYNTFKLTLNQT